MRHNRDEKRFDRTSEHLRSMFANMTNDVVTRGRITTTLPKAKVLRRHVEKMITLGKRGTLAARRRAMSFMRDKFAVHRLFSEIAPRYSERNGGYTRILKTGFRPGDSAPMSIIELVEGKKTEAAAPEAAPKAATKKAAPKKAAPRKAAPRKAEPKAEKEKPAKKEASAKEGKKAAPAKKGAAKKTAKAKKEE